MKKIFKKIKAKHLARVGLVMMLCVYVATFLCSMAVTINVDFNNQFNYPYDMDFITFAYLDKSYKEVQIEVPLGSSRSVAYNTFHNEQSPFLVIDGDLWVVDANDAYTLWVDCGLEDGQYNMFIFYGYNYSDGTNVYCPELLGTNIVKTSIGNGVCQHLCLSLTYPDGFVMQVTDITDTYDTENPDNQYLLVQYLVCIPSQPVPPAQDSITNVWSNLGTWIYSSISSVTGIFWNGTGLTLIGSICLVGTCIAICLLIFNKVRDFLNLQ